MFRSVYVVDVRTVGLKDQLAATWVELQSYSDLCPPTDMPGSVHLGVKPQVVLPDRELASAKHERYTWLFTYHDVNMQRLDKCLVSPLMGVPVHTLVFANTNTSAAALPSSYVRGIIGHTLQ